MHDLLVRLRAVFSPQALLALLCALLLLGFAAFSSDAGGAQIEKRAERVLSSVSGAGRVCVVIHTSDTESTGMGSSAKKTISVPTGAVAVAQGADDPVVHYQLQQALCALLSLPASAVSIVTGGK